MTGATFNHQLASACRQCHAACCKKGRLFLPRAEYEAIVTHLRYHAPGELDEFLGRVVDHEAFLLYDQKQACQFLDSANLCRLHDLGLKPTECFWWPYHVFATAAGGLEIRLATACCDAHLTHGPHSPYPLLIAEKVRALGPGVLRAFRQLYPGGAETVPVAALEASAPAKAPGP